MEARCYRSLGVTLPKAVSYVTLPKAIRNFKSTIILESILADLLVCWTKRWLAKHLWPFLTR